MKNCNYPRMFDSVVNTVIGSRLWIKKVEKRDSTRRREKSRRLSALLWVTTYTQGESVHKFIHMLWKSRLTYRSYSRFKTKI